MTPLRKLMLGAAAIAGLVGAHALDYALLIPDPDHRHDVLLRSGHGYLPFLLAAGAIAGLAALGCALATGVRGDGRRTDPAFIMAAVQGGGFVALEAVERLAAGASFDGSVLTIIACGVALQVVVAFASTRLLGLVRRAGAAVARSLRRRAPGAPAAPLPQPLTARVIGRSEMPSGAAHAVRGPPAPSFG